MSVDMKLLKSHLRIDGSEDDEYLAFLVSSAEEYLLEAGVPSEKKETAKYQLAVMLLVALNYENRNPGIEIDKVSFSLQSIILHLKTG
ncbi:head-tail connector protein [Paenibacillus anaericanus]|uniref:head-tail connector protein n=1 Tax=Paenibacillus anaericanus TaxID=170367 RepID=UPI001FE8F4BE|nr:head-tail connector protein [Paenibacillus anaericanus]